MGEFFRLMRKLEAHLDQNRWGTAPRDLSGKDYEDWFEAGERELPPERTLAWARAAIRRYNVWKWNQMMRDYRWLQKRMKKLGLNPEDARYLYQ